MQIIVQHFEIIDFENSMGIDVGIAISASNPSHAYPYIRIIVVATSYHSLEVLQLHQITNPRSHVIFCVK